MQPLQILVNGTPVQLLQSIQEVKSLIITHIQGFPLQVKQGMAKPVAEWLYNLTQEVDGYIEYNGVLMPSEDINKPQHMK